MSIVVTKNGQESNKGRMRSMVVSQATREMARGGSAGDVMQQLEAEMKTLGDEMAAGSARRTQIHTRLTFINETSKGVIGVDRTRFINERSSLIAELANLEKRLTALKRQRASLCDATSVHGPATDKGNLLLALCGDVAEIKRDVAEVLALLKVKR
jgi:hypothetical protein